MNGLRFIRPKNGKEIPFLILVSFLLTFIVSRLFVFAFPGIFITIKGEHIHHFAYGIILLAITNFLLLTQERTERFRLKLSIIYGFSLGLAFDEFVMWTQLDELYWDRTNVDAVAIITLILMNIVYFEGFWKKWGHRLGKFIRLISQI